MNICRILFTLMILNLGWPMTIIYILNLYFFGRLMTDSPALSHYLSIIKFAYSSLLMCVLWIFADCFGGWECKCNAQSRQKVEKAIKCKASRWQIIITFYKYSFSLPDHSTSQYIPSSTKTSSSMAASALPSTACCNSWKLWSWWIGRSLLLKHIFSSAIYGVSFLVFPCLS